MTLSDIRPAVPTSPLQDRGAVADDAVAFGVHPMSHTQLDMMRAFFCYEFEVERLDRDSLPTATPDAVAEWVEALAMSGLFAPTELRTMTQAWSHEPEALIRLLSGVDVLAARRGNTDVADAEVAAVDPQTPAAYLRAS